MYESASFALYACLVLKNLRLEMSDLRVRNRVLPKSSFEPYVVKCWYQSGRYVMCHGEMQVTSFCEALSPSGAEGDSKEGCAGAEVCQ